MILGYNTNGFSSHSLEHAIDVIAGLGYRSIGITVDHHALNPYEPEAEATLMRCAAHLRRRSLVPVVETGARFLLDPWRKHSPTLLADTSEERQRRCDFLYHCVRIAQVLEAPAVSLWSGAASGTVEREACDRRLIEGLASVCERAEAAGTVVAFEPEPGMHIESMADFDRIAAKIASPAFGLTLDLGHAHLTETSVEGTIRKYADRIANVHVEGMHRPNHEHLAPWDSGYDVKQALDVLREVGYQGPATLELSRGSHEAVTLARRAFQFLSA